MKPVIQVSDPVSIPELLHLRLKNTYCTHMSVDCCNTLVGSWLQQLAGDDLLNGKHNTIFTTDANGGSTIFYRLDCILDLEISAIW
jgi:hypothetical protein